LNYLRDASPQTRGMAAWCAGQLGEASAIPMLQKLYDDSAFVSVFVADGIAEYRVGDLARQAVRMIQDGKD
jgi:HEAT repeat protein